MKIADIIQYEGDNSTFVWKHPLENFNSMTQLIVHESQEAIFFMNGQVLDFFGPGRYTLEVENLPEIGRELGRIADSDIPFHCEVYFINKTVQMAVKWGTDSNIRFIEPTFGIPFEIGACGEMNLAVSNSRKLLTKIVGTTRGVAWDEQGAGFTKSLQSCFNPLIVSSIKAKLPVAIKAGNINLLEIDENLEYLSSVLREGIIRGFEEYGLTIPQFYITNVTLPENDPNFIHMKELHTVGLKTRMVQADALIKTVEADAEASVKAARRKKKIKNKNVCEEKARKKIKPVRLVIIAAVVLLCIVVATIIGAIYIPKQRAYKNALVLKEQGKLATAYRVMIQLDDFKDSFAQKELLKYLILEDITNLIRQGDYTAVDSKYAVLSNMKDFDKWVLGCQFVLDGKYIEAVDCGITEIIIPNGTERIADSAFYGCSNLISVTIPDSVTSIGPSAFSGCSALTNVAIPNSVTSIGASAFYGCSNLVSVTIPASVIAVGNEAFVNCSQLQEIRFLGVETKIEGGASTISSSAQIVAPAESQAAIYALKQRKLYLVEGNFGGTLSWKVNSKTGELVIEGSGYMPIWSDASEVPWYSCREDITSVQVLQGVRSIGQHSFEGCSRIVSVMLPNSVTNIGTFAFYGCSSLTNIALPNSVTSIGGYAFRDCIKLQSVKIPHGVTIIYAETFRNCNALASVDIPNSVTSVGIRTFEGCRSLTSITIPNSVRNIGSGAFYNCSALAEITIPSSVTNIESAAFYDCNSLAEIVIQGVATTIAGYGVLPETTTMVVPDGSWAQSYAIQYDRTYLIEGKCGVNLVWRYDPKLRELVISGTGEMTAWEEPKLVPWFSYREDIVFVRIAQGVTSIEDMAFFGCKALTDVTIPSSVKRIGYWAFLSCEKLVSVVLPNGLMSIDNAAFAECISLRSVTIPSSVTRIGAGAFAYCDSLSNVYFSNINGWYIESGSGTLQSISVTDPSINAKNFWTYRGYDWFIN